MPCAQLLQLEHLVMLWAQQKQKAIAVCLLFIKNNNYKEYFKMALTISMTQGFVVFLAFCYFACLFLAFFILYVIFESWQRFGSQVNKVPMVMSIYSCTFKSAIFESVKVKNLLKCVRMIEKSFSRRSENDTFESVWVSAHYLCHLVR